MSHEEYFLNGKYKPVTIPHGMRMSHWVYAPVVTEVSTNENLLNLEGNIWALVKSQEIENVISLTLSRYPDEKNYSVTINPITGKAKIGNKDILVSNIEEELDAIV
ncbi:hypothetical protein A3759_18300 [Thalassolituus sp. HI0120]|nr:hypothetical protein A3759_18300 [Thalassolituus sp. HI0120]